MRSFLDEVFHNMSAIFPKHSRMVYRLQERQIALHPIVSSVSDILIDALFDLLQDYERYLKQLVSFQSSCFVLMSSDLDDRRFTAIHTLRRVCGAR